jgi:hypothetical protein
MVTANAGYADIGCRLAECAQVPNGHTACVQVFQNTAADLLQWGGSEADACQVNMP